MSRRYERKPSKMFDSKSANAKEKHYLYNTLTAIVKALENEYTTIDLRGGTYVTGKIVKCDGYMNIELENVILYNSKGAKYPLKSMFINSRNIIYVHIPKEKSAMELLEYQLSIMNPKPNKGPSRRTFKQSRAEKYNKQTVQDAYKPSSSEKNRH